MIRTIRKIGEMILRRWRKTLRETSMREIIEGTIMMIMREEVGEGVVEIGTVEIMMMVIGREEERNEDLEVETERRRRRRRNHHLSLHLVHLSLLRVRMEISHQALNHLDLKRENNNEEV